MTHSPEDIINKEKWSDFLRRFIDVLKINMFIVDPQGRVLIPPFQERGRGRFGSRFLHESFRFDLSAGTVSLLTRFEKSGSYLEARDALDFHVFAVPVKAEDDQAVAYLIIGPVILNKAREKTHYLNLAGQLDLKSDDLMDVIHEIRVVSFVTIKAILDLLMEVAKDMLQLSIERQRLHQTRFNKELLPKSIAEAAQDMYAEIHLDELLVTILDVAINLVQAESGSIMILDEVNGEMSIKVSRGLNQLIADKVRVKMGEGIAGIAAQENSLFVISGTQGDNRIQHLLKRPEIKQSVVIPLTIQDKVLGVLSLHSKVETPKMAARIDSLKQLSRLVSTAIHSI